MIVRSGMENCPTAAGLRMKYGTIRKLDKPVSRIVFGCGRLGRTGFDLLDAAFAHGVNAFDSARIYAGSEAVLGEWVRAHGVRDEVCVITKGGHPMPRTHDRLTHADVLADLQTSLVQLRMDHVDVFLFHYDAVGVAAQEIVRIMEDIRRRGLACAVGGSNFSHSRIREIHECALRADIGDFDVVSAQWSLPAPSAPIWPGSVSLAGEAPQVICEFQRSMNVPLLAYSPLGRGAFTRDFWTEHAAGTATPLPSVRGITSDIARQRNLFLTPLNRERFRRAEILALRGGFTAPQVALAYVLQQPLNVFAIIGCAELGKLEENVKAAHVELSQRELTWLSCTDVPAFLSPGAHEVAGPFRTAAPQLQSPATSAQVQ